MTHNIKCESEFYKATDCGIKMFEVRKNDRNYQVFDRIYLIEVKDGVKTGRKTGPFEIKYILKGGQYGIDPEYCIMQLV